MTTARLERQISETGVAFTLRRDGELLPLSRWALEENVEACTGCRARVGALLRLREDELATDTEGTGLQVPWPSIVGLSESELRSLGLPPHARLTLELRATGAISDPEFRVDYGFLHADGRRVVRWSRSGGLLRIGEENFLLPDPIYPIVEDIDDLNAIPTDNREGRYLAWGNIAERLPEDAVADEHLRTVRVVVAGVFTIEPFLNEAGEPDFNAVLGRLEGVETEGGETSREVRDLLAPARQRDFAKRFRAFSEVRHRYNAGAGTYVVLHPQLEAVLREVKRAQAAPPHERLRFLENPSTFLREALEASGSPLELDDLFHDEGLSDRVRGVGVWEPKVLPWVQRAAEPWLPPEKFGLRLGDELIEIEKDEIETLIDAVQGARKEGLKTVEHRGKVIPATDQTEEALRRLLPEAKPAPKPDVIPEQADAELPQTLLVIDNFEAVNYERAASRSQTQPGRLPAVLSAALLGHQKEAFAWLQDHWCAGSPGALLADDMGLGKTVEALAFLAWLREEMDAGRASRRPILVVAPTGLLKNWLEEHGKHLDEPGLGEAVEAHGSGLQGIRRTQPRSKANQLPMPTLDVRRLQSSNWALTTYETLRDYQHSFARVHWAVVVFDEAQRIKNPAARVTDAALAMNCDFAVALTGTPVENRPADLWTIVDRAQPGRLGSLKAFSQRYEREEAQEEALPELRDLLLSRSAPPIMLRRLKEDHLEGLPEKHLEIREVEMPPVQAEAYEEAVNSARQGGSALSALHRLRSVSLHPYSPVDSTESRYIADSARLKVTFAILDDVRERDEKALLFVEALEMQDFLVEAIQRRYRLSQPLLVVNGSVAGKKRQERVNLFQSRAGFDVMILSPRAGGVGLTLTAASHVIHLSRWWNPAVEDQCTDRVFRIGQKRPVRVYCPIARHPRYGDHSFDVRLDCLLARKRELNRTLLAPCAATKGDIDDLYRSTVEMSPEQDSAGEPPPALDQIDVMEPLAFERWVLRELALAGYEVRRTPRQDGGADGLAMIRLDDQWHTVLIQCKHTQRAASCSDEAVEEVLRSAKRYAGELRGELHFLVVSNSRGFAHRATTLAAKHDVELVDRSALETLRRFRPARFGQ